MTRICPSIWINSAGDVALFGVNVDDNPMIDSVEDYGVIATDVSLARQPDGSGNWESDSTATAGSTNQ